MLAIGTIVGCIAAPFLAERLGRRRAMADLLRDHGLSASSSRSGTCSTSVRQRSAGSICIFLLGFGGANFALYTLWLPEQHTTDCRASAIAFVSSVGRFVGVAMVFLVGAGIQSYGSLGMPVAITAIAFIFGLILVPMSEETRGKSLPA